MSRRVGAVLAAICLSSPAAAQAVTGPGKHEGLYARAGVSGNYLSLTRGVESFRALGTGFSIAAGHAVLPGLFFFGAFDYDLAIDPEMERDGRAQIFDGLSMRYLSIGPGAAFYLPSDYYLSLTLSWSSVSVTSDANPDAEASTGFGARIGVGKEWGVFGPLSLGVGANFFVGSVSREGDTGTPMAAGLAISALYD